VQVTIAGAQNLFTVDTGSCVTSIQPGVSPNGIRTANVTPIGVTGDELEVTGEEQVEFRCNNCSYTYQFYVFSLPTEADGIFGMDFRAAVNKKVDFQKRGLRLLKSVNLDTVPANRKARGANGMANSVTRCFLKQMLVRGERMNQCIPMTLDYKKQNHG
jgi:hypothetical protein